eukprot:c1122_g1_i2.p1 GENE.c1122_g1_i2~~c1122_g1_i2.p1  ORF type:complete len:312 (-),score=95.09 c1122_g1_i2:334-1269(-)
MISHQELMRVYGALMWSLGKVMKTPEVARVYVSSFWDNAKSEHVFISLFNKERQDLLLDLRHLPKSSTMNKVNEFVKRCRLLKVHVCIISHLSESMPAMFGKKKKAEELIENLDAVFAAVQRKHQLPVGDFPNLEDFREKLKGVDFTRLKQINQKKLKMIDDLLTRDVPLLINTLGEEAKGKVANPFDNVQEGLFQVVESENEWAIPQSIKDEVSEIFTTITVNGDQRVPGGVVRAALEKTGLTRDVLRAIWNLACIDGQGALDRDEFTVAWHLAKIVTSGKQLPKSLPLSLIPPSKRASPMYAANASRDE